MMEIADVKEWIKGSKYHYVNDLIPESLHETYKGWTVHGAYSHRNNNDAWSVIVANDGEQKLYINYLERRIEKHIKYEKTYQAIIIYLGNMIDGLLNILFGIRNWAKDQKAWAYSDLIRDEIHKLGITTKDTKEGTIYTYKEF